jgi:hypothetical protein
MLPVASKVHNPVNLTVEAQVKQFIIRARRANQARQYLRSSMKRAPGMESRALNISTTRY